MALLVALEQAPTRLVTGHYHYSLASITKITLVSRVKGFPHKKKIPMAHTCSYFKHPKEKVQGPPIMS
uniref:Uncharacterized protein n=1 Tax=Populus trichocarpa TaxID=3694 RepID=A0A2K1XRR5_POPTR